LKQREKPSTHELPPEAPKSFNRTELTSKEKQKQNAKVYALLTDFIFRALLLKDCAYHFKTVSILGARRDWSYRESSLSRSLPR
jgi:hypothetical protein